MQPNKVMIIIPSLGVGGAETMVENLANGLKEKTKVVLIVFFNTGSPIENRLKKNGINVISLNKPLGFSVKGLLNLWKLINIEKPDIIHTHLHVLPYAWLASGKRPIVHTVHSIAKQEQSGWGKIICGFIYKYSKRCMPIALTPLIKKSLMDEYSIRDNRITIISNGVDFRNYRQKTNYDINGGVKIVHVGRFFDVKNHELIVECIQQLKPQYCDVHIWFLGDGETQSRITQLVKEKHLEDNVSFEGVKAVSEYLVNADIFILPSKYEGMPMSLIEAMGVGLPIVASDVGGIPNMIKNEEEGLLIEPTVEQLKKAICRLIDNKELRTKIGKGAYKKSSEYSAERMTESYFELYQRIMK